MSINTRVNSFFRQSQFTMLSEECKRSSVHMTSTRSSAEIKASTVHVFTNHLDNDLETTDGNASKDPCGAKRIQLKPKFSVKSKTLQMQSNFISSTDNLEFSDGLNCTSSSNNTSFDSMKMDKKRKDTTLPCNTSALQDLHAKAITACGDWERSVHTRYSAVEGRIIRSMNRYLVNQIRGYGRFNHESLFKSHRASDPSGRLYEETERGFELWKEFLEVRKLMKKLKSQLNMRYKK